jgi:hypothetical protein
LFRQIILQDLAPRKQAARRLEMSFSVQATTTSSMWLLSVLLSLWFGSHFGHTFGQRYSHFGHTWYGHFDHTLCEKCGIFRYTLCGAPGLMRQVALADYRVAPASRP